MREIREIQRYPAPGPEPLGLAVDGATLWVSAREGHRLYAMDPATWTVRDEFETPGAPFGVAVAEGELRVVIGFGDDDDDRYIYRCTRSGIFARDRIECPELSGVHLAYDGGLLLSQAHNKKILQLDNVGAVTRGVSLERRPLGLTVAGDALYLVTGDEEFRNHEVAKLDTDAEVPRLEAVASIPFRARDLAFDGSRFWTTEPHRNEILAFEVPAQ
jgi:hypothetical protein